MSSASEEWDLADWRANKTVVNDRVEDGEPIPPGVNRSAFYNIETLKDKRQMNTNIIPINAGAMPAAMRARMQAGCRQHATSPTACVDAFPLLSIRGGKASASASRQGDSPHRPQRAASCRSTWSWSTPPSTVARSIYANPYSDQGDMNPPDCWSLDWVRPDASIAQPINPTCADCPMNVFGSAEPRREGKRGGKACADARRIARGHAAVPRPSGRRTARHAEGVSAAGCRRRPEEPQGYTVNLERNGWDADACITRLSFDSEPISQAEVPLRRCARR